MRICHIFGSIWGYYFNSSALPKVSDWEKFMKIIYLGVCYIIFFVILFAGRTAQAITYAYVANSSANTITVIRTSDQMVIKTLEVGNAPHGIAVSPLGNNVYVTNEADGTVSVIKTSDHTISDTVKVGNSPRGIAVDPDDAYVYVTNYADNTVSVITTYDDDENEVTAVISVGNGPYGIEAGVDGAYIYVTNSTDHSLSIIRTDDHTVMDTLGISPSGVVASPDGRYLYVSNSDSNTVSVIYAEDNDDDDDLIIKDHTLDAIIPVGNNPTGIATTGEGAYVFVANSADDTVSVIRTSDNRVIHTLSVTENPYGVAAPANGRFVYVLGTNETISMIHTDDFTVTSYKPVENASLIAFGHFIGGRPPVAPEDLTVEDSLETQIDLSWKDTSFDELGFKIKRKLDTEDTFTLVATLGPDVTSYRDTGLEKNTYYRYIIQSYNEAANSSFYSPIYTLTDDEEDDGGLGCFIGSISREPLKSVMLVSIVSLILIISGVSFLILKYSGRQNRLLPFRVRVKKRIL
jgi:YVTN family beta-propeller protein